MYRYCKALTFLTNKNLFTFSYEISKIIRVPAPIVEGPLPADKGDMD
jgi:hypothetical protein